MRVAALCLFICTSGCGTSDASPAAAAGGSARNGSGSGGTFGTSGGASSVASGGTAVVAAGGASTGGANPRESGGDAGAGGFPSSNDGGDASPEPPVLPCEAGDAEARPVPVAFTNAGTPPGGEHTVVVETAPSLPGYTIYRPVDLSKVKALPLIAWGNGGCMMNGVVFGEIVSEFASHGYFVVVDGPPDGVGFRSIAADGAPLLSVIDWAEGATRRACSPYHGKIDVGRIAVMGQSCGGLMAIAAGVDPRVTTVVQWNSGLFAADEKIYAGLHTPLAIIDGGPSDIAYANGRRQFDEIDTVPVVFANLDVGHMGTHFEDNGGEYGRVGVAWLAWQLRGDTSAPAKGLFSGSGCGLCSGGTGWTLEKKGID